MAINPLYQSNDSPNNSTQPTKSVNRQGVYVPRTHNTFDNSYYHFTTQKFGQYEPFFVMEGVPGDTIPLHSSHNVRSLPMSSPFLSELKLNKDYFMVPMQAILPNTWEYIFKNPTQGDDVPEDANCLLPAFTLDDGDASLLSGLFDFVRKTTNSLEDRLRILLVLEMFCSQGSLLAKCGYHLNPIINNRSFDDFFDSVIADIQELSLTVEINNELISLTYEEGVQPAFYSGQISIYQALSLLRSYGSLCRIDSISVSPDAVINKLFLYSGLPTFPSREDFGTDINLKRILSYQLACSQFYVNPQVDFLYNAQLYRDNIYTLWRNCMQEVGYASDPTFFSMNGVLVPYDYLSMNYLQRISDIVIQDDLGDCVGEFYDFWNAILGYRESLRFGDYFTDSRTRPLALGDDSIEVSQDNNVSVIDVSKKIVYQRFRNAVVKLGNNFGDYLRGIFGTTPSPDYHYPKFISHQDFNIGGFEVANNTADGQGDLVTNLNTRDDTFAFEVQIDMPCVLIGISYFSVPRVYMQTKDRQFFHRDRYDEFNPMLQYIGDQIVYNHERTDLRPNDEIFGYQSRNNEYKQRYGIVSGGFSTKLPAWTFVADSLFNPIDHIAVSNTQSPDFIRAHDYEFNRFFAMMSGFSLANSFHFIVVYNNKCMSTRPMEVNPNIL